MNIPDYCYTLNNMTVNSKTKIGEIVMVKAFESGYYPTIYTGTQEDVDAMNTTLGVTRAEEEAMSAGSMFGWQVYNNVLKRYQELLENKNANNS